MPRHLLTTELPQDSEPFWIDSVKVPTFSSLRDDLSVDVVIVGGGITGITTAYLLVNEGLQVALLEADTLLHGTTGHTTAKITAQHGLLYDELIRHMGMAKAKLYFESNIGALRFIKKTILDQHIQCDFREEDAYIYATAEESANKIELEYKAYQKLGIDSEWVDEIPFAIKIQNALAMKNQAQFHPLAYLTHLVRMIADKGGLIFTGTTAVKAEEGDRPAVMTKDGYRVTADKVLACSHFPFYDGQGFYFARMQAERSYVIAARTDMRYPGGMYINADQPTRSLRSAQIGDETVALIGGESHIAGRGKDTLEHYWALETFGQEVLGLKEVLYRWSAQDLVTLDKVPYIGEITSGNPNVLVATGYKKWGMTTGTLAAQLLRDCVLERDNPYQKLYAPTRFYADPSLKNFLIRNGAVAGRLIKGKFEIPDREASDVTLGEGAVVTFNGERAGAYKDMDGELFIVDTTCTHLGCEVEWNHGDRTWDCPCHGSRFSYTGDVVEGPANEPLLRLQ